MLKPAETGTSAMKLMIQTAMIFFGTLMAAAVVALGKPAPAQVAQLPILIESASLP